MFLVSTTQSSQAERFLSKYPTKIYKVHPAKEPTNQNHFNEIVVNRRPKRDVIQLAMLVQKGTKYNAEKLLNYGNYCGIGSDRAGDGSVIDNCDDCCRKHDNCYDGAMYSNSTDASSKDTQGNETETLIKKPRHLNCIPYFLTYKLANISGNDPYCVVDKENNSENTDDGSCALKICKCDLQFVRCMQPEPCPLF